MDDPSLDAAEHARALRGLARINRVSGSIGVVWPAIEAAARRAQGSAERQRVIRVVDVACGGGDVAIAVKRRAVRAGLGVEVIGCDVSETALEYARAAAERAGVDVRFERVDALAGPLPVGDVIMCSLFLHHLTEDQAGAVLGHMRDAATAEGQSGTVLVNDLRRSRVGHAAAVVGTRLLSRSTVVHVDGPRSVRAAFTVGELRALAERAGLPGARVERVRPWRVRLMWRAVDDA